MDEVLRVLCKMKRPELVAMAGEFHPPVSVGPKWNTRKIALAIRQRQKEDAGTNSAGSMSPALPGGKDAPAVPADQAAQPLPGFLDDKPGDEGSDKIDGRGGPRPGAGRPLGMTDEKAKVRNLPTIPNETVVKLLLMAGGMIAGKTGIAETVFTRQEAEELGLPVTQLQEYYFPDGIPEIAWAWVSLIVTIYSVADAKVKIVKAARAAAAVKELEPAKPADQKPEGPASA
jgi:hypothetical protein